MEDHPLRNRSVYIAMAAAAALVFAFGAGSADAKKKRRGKVGGPSCSVSYLKLVEGNTWTYRNVNPVPNGPPPAELTLTVKSIEAGDDGKTVITVVQSFRGRTHETPLTCSAEGLVVPPHSFLFAGEAGADPGITRSNEEHNGVTYPNDASYRKVGATGEELYKADVTRDVAEGSGAEYNKSRVEVERLYLVASTSTTVETEVGSRNRATRIGFQIQARSFVDEKDRELPVANNGDIWIDRKLGAVRFKDSQGLEWALSASNLLEE